MKKILIIAAIALTMGASCTGKKEVTETTGEIAGTTAVALGYSKYYPDATAFRMSGNYSNNVAVTLNEEGELTYFPAPSDITADSEPTRLDGGWWLNNQGLGPNSVFTKYTFAEYASLPETPSPEQIKQKIIHGARVTDFMELPMKSSEARENVKAANDYIKSMEIHIPAK